MTPPKRRRRLSEDDKAQILELRGKGWPPKEIAKKMGIAQSTVSRFSGPHKRPGGSVNQYTRPPAWEDEEVSHWPSPFQAEPHYPDDLPDLEQDDFNWTPEELRDAVQEARRLLFPSKEETS